MLPNVRGVILTKSINSLAFNCVAILGDARQGQIADQPGSVGVVRSIMAECERVVGAMGITLDASIEERIVSTLGSRNHTMSGLHDLRSGRANVEVGDIFRGFQSLGEAFGIALPMTTACVELVRLRCATAAEALEQAKAEHEAAIAEEEAAEEAATALVAPAALRPLSARASKENVLSAGRFTVTSPPRKQIKASTSFDSPKTQDPLAQDQFPPRPRSRSSSSSSRRASRESLGAGVAGVRKPIKMATSLDSMMRFELKAGHGRF